MDFSESKFAFLIPQCRTYLSGFAPVGLDVPNPPKEPSYSPIHSWLHLGHFNYPGKTASQWNEAYFDEEGAYFGEDFPNTAYVHIYERTIPKYAAKYGSITVIQYKYFYPYNDWWNNHEGDWQGIDVVVSSRNPVTAEFLGVEYRFHGVWLSYYKDYDDKPGITGSVVFNPQRAVRLIGTHPVAYIGAGSHAAYPIGGEIELFSNLEAITEAEGEEGVSGTAGVSRGDKEYMSHTGLVLSTLADGSHNDLWERYNLVLLPNPNPTNTNNMGLDPDMSWLGAQIRWGTPQVDGPVFASGKGNESPKHGPYNRETGGWGDLKLFDGVGKIGFKIPVVGGLTRVNAFDPFHHSDLERTSYHHWAVIGTETWNGTVSLSGDVVVFPGATLTIEAGTTVTFPSQRDRHQFKEGNHSLSELFVYGTLQSDGTSSSPVVLRGPNPSDNARHWGGIRMLAGSSERVRETEVRNAPPPSVRPENLTAQVGDGSVTLRWDEPSLSDPSLTGWQYRTKPAGPPAWGAWTGVSGRATRQVVVSPLAHGVRHQFEVRAVNTTGGGPASDIVSASLVQVAFSAAGYTLIESGNPVGPQEVTGQVEDPTQAAQKVQVGVQLTPVPDRRVTIPLTVAAGSAEAADYEVRGLPASGGLSFAVGRASKGFTIWANPDADFDDETIQVGFGRPLPVGVGWAARRRRR